MAGLTAGSGVTNRRAGLVGVGMMGSPVARRLCGAGWRVLLYDADAARARALAEETGSELADSLAEFAQLEFVICLLPSSDIVDKVVGGAGGLLEAMRPGSLIIDCGSSEPRRTIALAESARRRGLDLVDAPVSGGVARAVTGELTVMFGGSEEQLERCRPLLGAFGAAIIRVGSVGSGHAMKALNNMLSAVGLTIATEVIEVGKRFGIDPAVMLDVINRSTGRNHATETKIDRFVLSRTFASGFSMRLMVKDLTTAIALAKSQEVPSPLSEACLALWQRASQVLPPDADQTLIALLPEQRTSEPRS